MALTKVKASNITLSTPAASSNDTTPATTAYVTTALANLVDSAPGTLNTLNELAAALGDDANFSTTVTTSIAAKLPQDGTGAMTGPLVLNDNVGAHFGGSADLKIVHDGSDSYIKDTGTGNLLIQYSDLYFSKDAGSTHSVVFRDSGKVGIGTTGPARTLHVKSPDANIASFEGHQGEGLVIVSNTNGRVDIIGYDDGASSYNPVVLRGHTSDGLVVDTSGRVGIGTGSSADTQLHVKNTGSIELRLEADSNNNGQEDCFVRFYTDGKMQEGIAGMDNNNSSTLFGSNTENAMVFGTVSNLPTLLATNNTERMIITAAGKVGIGTSSPGGTLDVHSSSVGITVEHDGNNHFNHVGEFFAPNTTANRNALFAVGKSGSSKNTGYLGYYWTASGSNNNFAHISHWASDYLFRVYGQGNYYFAGSSISDRDLKENIVDIPEPSLDKVKQLRVRKFNMIPLGDDDVTPTKVGFIAQEVQEAMPNVVTGTDGNKDMAVDTTGVVGHLVKAVQELSEKLDAAEARITELEG